MLVKIQDGAVVAYPYDLGCLRNDHPDKSIPRKLTPSLLSELGAAMVCTTDYPVYDPETHQVVELTPVCIDGAYYQRFEVQAQ